MNEVVRLETAENVGILWIDNPPVNAISHAVRKGIVETLQQADADDDLEAYLLICQGRTFMAGADIKEFGRPWEDPGLPEVVEFIEARTRPVVAALHGTALGGGFEIALGCHFRCALPSAQVGFPEVNLGILPGAQGTQRLPRLVGIRRALDMIVTGRPIDAREALKLGAFDELIEGDDLLAGALEYTEHLVNKKVRIRRLSERPIARGPVPDGFFDEYRKKIARKTRGFKAPEACVQALEAAASLPFEQGVARERELFQHLVQTQESKAQRHVFFGERTVARIPGIPKDTTLREINKVGIVGAGTMGGGIAMAFADAGYRVRLKEIDQEALDAGLDVIEHNYRHSVNSGRLRSSEMEKRLGRIVGTLDYDDLKSVDLAIEAVFEDPDLKKTVLGELAGVCRKNTILASNTSTLDLDELAVATGRPADVIGMHFFSPANVMRLLEVVRGAQTSNDVVATAMKLARSIGKIGVLSGVCFGFIGNRMFEPLQREKSMLLLEGASPEQIDAALVEFGFAMGPCAVNDLAGIDVGYKIRRSATHMPDDPRYARIDDLLSEAGRHGLKTGAGFYRYQEGSRHPLPDPEVDKLIRSEAKRLGVERRKIAAEEIVQRCVYPLINEGARVLEEGIALRSVDIDVVWVYGYGFPVWRGGPMFWADHLGLAQIRDRLQAFAARDGDAHGYWQVAPLLDRLAAQGKGFEEAGAA